MTRYDEIISEVASALGLPCRFVDRTYRAYWEAVREHIQSLPLKEDLTDEDFLKLRPNINIPSIGKLFVTLERYRRIKNQHYEILKEKDRHVTH